MGLKFGSYILSTYEVEVEGVMVTRGSVIYCDHLGNEISRERYDPSVDGSGPTEPDVLKPGQGIDPMFGDIQSSDYLTFTFNASEDFSGCDEGVSNRFIKRGGGNYTNITPFIIWNNSRIIGMTLSSREDSKWIAEVYCNGIMIASLDSEGKRVAVGDCKVEVKKGDCLSLYVNGEGVQNPGIEVILSSYIKK